jgi:hypothetical protein
VSLGVVWWYPASSAALVSLSVRVGALQVTPERQGTGVQALSGRVHHATLGQADRVGLELSAALSLTDDADLVRVRDRLASLEDHLLSGGLIGLAATATTAWAAVVSGALATAGATTVAAASGLPSAVSGSIAAGSRLVVRDDSARQRREEHTVSTKVGPLITLQHGVLAGMSGAVLIRQRETYPALRLAPEGRGALIENADGVVYRLRCDLIEDVATAREVLAQPELLAARTLGGPAVLAAAPRRSWVRP